jgi:long-chain acyl-CoA synthetase
MTGAMSLTRSSWPAENSENVIAATVGDVLRAAAAGAPDLTALVAGRTDPAVRGSWTYADLLAEAEHAARALLEIVSPGERIAVWAPKVPEWVDPWSSPRHSPVSSSSASTPR